MKGLFGNDIDLSEHLSQKDFAERVGLTGSMISQLTSKGVLKKLPNGKYSYEKNLALLKKHYDEQAAKGGKNKLRDMLSTGPEKAEQSEEISDDIDTIDISRKKQEDLKRRMMELQYEEQIGKLVSREKACKGFADIARRTHESIMVVPSRIAALVAAETDPNKVHQMLTRELRGALLGLSDWVRDEYVPTFGFEEPK